MHDTPHVRWVDMPHTPLCNLLQAGNVCVRLVTLEEPEVLRIALDAAGDAGREPWVWSATVGLGKRRLAGEGVVPDTMHPAGALTYLRKNLREPAVCIFLDLADHLEDKLVVRCLRDLVEHFRQGGENMELRDKAHVVMIDARADVPAAIEFVSVRWDVPPPDDEEIEALIKSALRRVNARRGVTVSIPKRDYRAIVENLRGLARRHVEQLIMTVASDGQFTADDLQGVLEAKRSLLKTAGVLEFVERPQSMDGVGGLANLKRWLVQREAGMTPEGKAAGLPAPRGVLLLGVQGSGKSLASKAIATAWKRPLLRLDPGTLYDRYVGESERRLRESLRQAEAMAPVVLWIDEIEKGFASAASQSVDGGLSKRLFGTLLMWMQEHEAPVFVVATANDIEALPPELLRKGRFDEIFFVDLPGDIAREQIVGIHLRRRGQDISKFDVRAIVSACEGFSGAEIEQGIVSAMYGVHAAGRTIATADVVKALEGSPPLSVTMREKVRSLRAWAVGRCVPAD